MTMVGAARAIAIAQQARASSEEQLAVNVFGVSR
jgi:hypothetical protein